MKSKQILISILALLLVFPLMRTFAQQAANSVSIRVITTFDYPGTGNLTQPQKINDRGDIVGIYLDSNLVQRGFIRFNNGSFSAPIVEPNDTGDVTKDEASITHAQSAVTTSEAIASITGISCRAAPSQNTTFRERSAPLYLA
jgi:hypothetical protein